MERLKKALENFKGVPEEQVDMNQWWKPNCKTVGCFCGWACSIPEFQEQGLHLRKLTTYYAVCWEDPVTGDVHTEERAISKFFGLEEEDTFYLFFPWKYATGATKENVIKRVQEFIEQGS